MGLTLRSGISFCEVAGRLIFLDVVADRYFCLGRHAEHAFRLVMEGSGPDDAAEAALSRLEQAGLLVPSSGGVVAAPCARLDAPQVSLLDVSGIRVRAPMKLVVLGDLAATRISLRFRPLHAVLSRLAAQKCHVEHNGDAPTAAFDVAAAFDWSARVVRSHDQCLPRSIAVARRLFALGVSADLVIGVSLNPFAAHSWVQRGSALVNDSVDGVRHFTPILVI